MKAAITLLDAQLRQLQGSLDTALADVAMHEAQARESRAKADKLRGEVEQMDAAVRKLKAG